MKTRKTPLSIRIIYWVINVTFYLYILVGIVFLIKAISVYAGYHAHSASMEISSFSIALKFLGVGHLHINNQIVQLKLAEASAKMSFANAPDSIVKIIETWNFMFCLFGAYLFWIGKKFIKNVKNGETFTARNINLLKRVSYVVLGLATLQLIFTEVIFHLYLAGSREFSHIQLVRVDTQHFIYLLLSALLIWVLAHIFIVGLKLQKENDLTI